MRKGLKFEFRLELMDCGALGNSSSGPFIIIMTGKTKTHGIDPHAKTSSRFRSSDRGITRDQFRGPVRTCHDHDELGRFIPQIGQLYEVSQLQVSRGRVMLCRELSGDTYNGGLRNQPAWAVASPQRVSLH